jgi:hypothetical protein
LDSSGKLGFSVSLEDIDKQFARSFDYYVSDTLVAIDANSLLLRFLKGS